MTSAAQIGRYDLVARIGVGGMGEVFLARASGAGGFAKEVVIKRILPHLASDPGFVQRFIEEGKLVVRLRHAGIAQVLDMGEEDGVFFIAMEHVDGKDLGELMRVAAAAKKPLPVPLVVHLLVALLDALDYAHRAKDGEGRPLGIIHRDVSPSNVMIATTGEVKLLDFGIARAAERLQHSTTGAIRGKYSYMSPQQAAGAELDPRSDLFSVGVIAWELLTGERPFDGTSDLLTLDRIRFHDPGSLVAKAPQVPADLAAIIERLLAKAAEARYASADEVAQALRSHIMLSGKLATARELAAWMEEVVATLPRALRERSMQGLSVDDLLLLGLGSEPGAPGASTPAGRELKPHTVLATYPIASGAAPPGSAPFGSLARPAVSLDVAGGVAGGALPPAGPTPASAPTPAPAPASAPMPTPALTSTAARGETGGRGRFGVLLIGLNLALIALVLFLVLRDDEAPPALPDATGLAGGEVAAPSPDTTITPEIVAAKAAPDTAVAGPSDTSPSEASAPIPLPELRAGVAAGEALATVGDSVFAAELELTVRAHPPGALVAISGLGSARAPRTISARKGIAVSGRVTAPDHEPRTFEAIVGAQDAITVSLKPVPRGKLQFKFFPADGTRVTIDGKPFAVGSNVVAAELPIGPHTLVLEGKGGGRLTRPFKIEEGKTTSLGTLDVGGE